MALYVFTINVAFHKLHGLNLLKGQKLFPCFHTKTGGNNFPIVLIPIVMGCSQIRVNSFLLLSVVDLVSCHNAKRKIIIAGCNYNVRAW